MINVALILIRVTIRALILLLSPPILILVAVNHIILPFTFYLHILSTCSFYRISFVVASIASLHYNMLQLQLIPITAVSR